MKNFSLTVALATLPVGLGQLPSFAQPSPTVNLLEALGQRCNRATEVSYRSDQLISADGETTVYFEAVLRKIVRPDSTLHRADTDDYCFPDVRETPVRDLVIEHQGEIQRIDTGAYEYGYILYSPRSFSPDGRYVAIDLQVAFTGGSPGDYVGVFDLEQGDYIPLTAICEQYEFEQTAGFLDVNTVSVECIGYGPAESLFEQFDLTTGEIRTLPDEFGSSRYGSVTRPFEVIQTQSFD